MSHYAPKRCGTEKGKARVQLYERLGNYRYVFGVGESAFSWIWKCTHVTNFEIFWSPVKRAQSGALIGFKMLGKRYGSCSKKRTS